MLAKRFLLVVVIAATGGALVAGCGSQFHSHHDDVELGSPQ